MERLTNHLGGTTRTGTFVTEDQPVRSCTLRCGPWEGHDRRRVPVQDSGPERWCSCKIPRVGIQFRPPMSPPVAVSHRTRRSHRGMEFATSTASRGRCRHPSSRSTSSPRATGCSSPITSPRHRRLPGRHHRHQAVGSGTDLARAPPARRSLFGSLTIPSSSSPYRLRPTGTPLRVTVTVSPADRNQFIVNIGDAPGAEYQRADEADQLEQGSGQPAIRQARD